MKTLLLKGAAGVCLILPGICAASTVSFVTSGSDYTLLFDPQGSGPSQLPTSFYYRAYDCRIGSKPQPVVTFTPPSNQNHTPNITPPTNNPPANNPPLDNPPTDDSPAPGNNNPPPGNQNPPANPPTNVLPPLPPPCNPVAVPLPDPAAMSGAGLGIAFIARWIRARRRTLR